MSTLVLSKADLAVHTCPCCSRTGTLYQATPKRDSKLVIDWYACSECPWRGPVERLAAIARAQLMRSFAEQVTIDVEELLAEDAKKGERKSSGDSCKREEKPGDALLKVGRPEQGAFIGGRSEENAFWTGEPKDQQVIARCTRSQKTLFELAAEQNGQKMSEWMLEALQAAAREALLVDPLKFAIPVKEAQR